MVDILGPTAAALGTTLRSADDRTFGVDDTWFADCSTPTAEDGTEIRAAFLNLILAQFRDAIRGMGVAEDNGDDMLLRAIQAAQNAGVAAAAAAAMPAAVEVITAASGNWAKPANLRYIKVRMIGGGGGGGGSNTASFPGGGGGNGGYAEAWIPASYLSASMPFTVGAGGAGVAANTASPGGAGGATTFAGITAPGGGFGGHSTGSTPGIGGNSSTPTFPAPPGGDVVKRFGLTGAFGESGGYLGMVMPSHLNPWGRGGKGGFTSAASGAGQQGVIIIESFLNS